MTNSVLLGSGSRDDRSCVLFNQMMTAGLRRIRVLMTTKDQAIINRGLCSYITIFNAPEILKLLILKVLFPSCLFSDLPLDFLRFECKIVNEYDVWSRVPSDFRSEFSQSPLDPICGNYCVDCAVPMMANNRVSL